MKQSRTYSQGPFGQIHSRIWGEHSPNPPLLCLTPSPYSGAAYETLAPLLAGDRCVIAPDYPGYGSSDSTPSAPAISDYAASTIAVANDLAGSQVIDLLGFHTGCLVAVETALRWPDRVNSIVLVDVPYFGADIRTEYLTHYPSTHPLSAELSSLEKDWEFCITNRIKHIPHARAFTLFVDQISAGEQRNAAFRAAFSYPCEERFAQLRSTTHVVATKAGLYDQSLAAAKAIADASLLELPDIKMAVLDVGATLLASRINQILSTDAAA